MKLTKFVFASLLAVTSAEATFTAPFDKKADIMKLVDKRPPLAEAVTAKKTELEKTEADITALGWDQDAADATTKECKDVAAENSRQFPSSIELPDDPKADEAKAAELKKKCEAFKKKETSYKALKEAETKQKKEVSDKEKAVQKLDDEVKALNPGFTPATLDTIRATITGGAFEFLVPEVTKDSSPAQFEAFKKKLTAEVANWETMKGLDQAEVDKNDDNKAKYEDRIKADDLALKAITDYSGKVVKAASDSEKAKYEVAEAQYMADCLKANIAQATTLKAIDTEKAEDYQKYITAMEKFAGIRNDNLNKKTSELGGGGQSWMIYGLMAVISVIVIVGGVKKCKDKKD